VGRRKIRKKQQKEIAIHRIRILFSLAKDEALKGNFPRADRYVYLARQMAMKTQTPVPREFKRWFCKHCYRFFLPGRSGRVRIQHGKIIMFCWYCKRYQRIPLSRRKSSRDYSRV
jgi:ribonuclease P protein subunit RPR2